MMGILNLAVTLVHVMGNPVTSVTCETVRQKRIAGGHETSSTRYPYVVSLQSNSYKHFCGGVITSNRSIVTAARCVFNRPKESISVKTGDADIRLGKRYRVAKVVVHEGFNRKTLIHDIAMLKLSSPMRFSDTTRDLPLIEEAYGLNENDTVTAIGWGALRHPNNTRLAVDRETVVREGLIHDLAGHLVRGQFYPTRLRSVNLNIISDSECVKYFKLDTLENKICMMSMNKGECEGDSGGPVIFADHLLGIISGGKGCASGYPSVVVKIDAYREWIDGVYERIALKKKIDSQSLR
ncbi:hypothetical protein QAD02_003793 [Eretmocerus hayati]|uniref:Uncharacterized protein n=1 Tax=Eretmocerus hayati TaxID=131215 RepID=A0ACC2NMN7_9HYME|nr:hypothetical protein QAD02_003793 [Eretmocerus hayati]